MNYLPRAHSFVFIYYHRTNFLYDVIIRDVNFDTNRTPCWACGIIREMEGLFRSPFYWQNLHTGLRYSHVVQDTWRHHYAGNPHFANFWWMSLRTFSVTLALHRGCFAIKLRNHFLILMTQQALSNHKEVRVFEQLYTMRQGTYC